MEERLSELADEFYLNDSIRNIALEFEVPPLTAAAWERNIGDVDVLNETLGKNGPDDYIDIIRRREWIPRERENREEEWVEHLKRWCTERAQDVHLVHESERQNFRRNHGHSGMQWIGLGSGWSAVALTDGSTKSSEQDTIPSIHWTDEMADLKEQIDKKEKWVKYEMRRVDPEWIGLTRELRSVEKTLIEIYQDHLEGLDRQFSYKKDEIMELKEAFPYLRTNAGLVADATNSSNSYVNKFKYVPGEGIANRRVKGRLRDDVLQRDDYACVSCGKEDELRIHHIIPRAQGGQNAMENLSTLCADCHYHAHCGGKPIDDKRDTTASWDSVVYEGQTEFWKEWVHQDLDEGASKGFSREDGGNSK